MIGDMCEKDRWVSIPILLRASRGVTVASHAPQFPVLPGLVRDWSAVATAYAPYDLTHATSVQVGSVIYM